jgi:NTE family protein
MAPEQAPPPGDLAFVLTGGGARGAYQVGVMAWIAERYPELHLPIITGVSAGAVNAAYLASRRGTFGQAVEELVTLWSSLTPEQVFRVDAGSLGWTAARWGFRLASGGLVPRAPQARGFLDTQPLRSLLEEVFACVDRELTGIDYNLHRGALKAVAISTTSYSTGQAVTFVHGQDIHSWTRPLRRGVVGRLTVDHVMASAAIPLFFPAVQLGRAWYGDGGVRLIAPLSPALHLGAGRLLAISTRSGRTQKQANRPAIHGYPPPIQVFGVLLDAVFLDLIDQDASRLERMNRLIAKLSEEEREGMRLVDLLVLRPSRDLGRLVRAYEPRLPLAFRFMTRGLGTKETRSPDILSMLMFQPEYLTRLIQMGKADADARGAEIEAFLSG